MIYFLTFERISLGEKLGLIKIQRKYNIFISHGRYFNKSLIISSNTANIVISESRKTHLKNESKYKKKHIQIFNLLVSYFSLTHFLSLKDSISFLSFF